MTTPTRKPADKSATANKPADKPATDNKPATPTGDALDFGSLTVVAADAPVRKPGGRRASWTPHPVLVDALNESWEGRSVLREYTDTATGKKRATYLGKGRAITVAESQAGTLVSAIRKVAEHLGYGCAVEVAVSREGVEMSANATVKVDKKVPAGKAEVRFAAKTRKESKSK